MLVCAVLLIGVPNGFGRSKAKPNTESMLAPQLELEGGRKLTFERVFSNEREVKPKRGFWTRVLDVVAGEPAFHALVAPYSVVTDSHGRVIVTDPAQSGIHVFDFSTQKYKFIYRDKENDGLLSPQCVAVDAADNIYVTDSETGKIFVFEPNGKFQRVIGSLKGGEGFFKRPTGIAIDSGTQRIYVSDTLRNKIFVLDMRGNVLQTIGKTGDGNGEFNFPTELRLHGDELVVVDAMNFRVQVLGRDRRLSLCHRPARRWTRHVFQTEGNRHRLGRPSLRGRGTAQHGSSVRPGGTSVVLLRAEGQGVGGISNAHRLIYRPGGSGLRSGFLQRSRAGVSVLRTGEKSRRGYAVTSKRFLVFAVILLTATLMFAQITGDVLGMHDLSPGGSSPLRGALPGSCLYCHAPHSGIATPTLQVPLWSQKLSVQPYTNFYTSSTNKTVQPTVGSSSSLCLSCHDGTVAVGTLQPYGQVPLTSGTALSSNDIVGPDLQSVHPFSFNLPINSAPDLWPSLSSTPPKTADTTGAVHLVNGNVECTSCHNPHVQSIDPNSNFLAINNANSTLCLACHSAVPSGSGMGQVSKVAQSRTVMLAESRATRVTASSQSPPQSPPQGTVSVSSPGAAGKMNPLGQWQTSIHATASSKVVTQVPITASSTAFSRTAKKMSLGNYSTVARNGCLSCHQTHNAQSQASLLRGADDQACISCHNGGSNVSPPAPNIFAELASPKVGHLLPAGNSSHQANESALLNQNRHANCVDCHNPHASNRAGNFGGAPALRPSQNGVVGISAADGVTVLTPAVNQYENCLRCHGASTGKQARATFGYLPNSIGVRGRSAEYYSAIQPYGDLEPSRNA